MPKRKGQSTRDKTRLTEKEIDALLALVAIAEAGTENEGDYADFDYPAMDSARKKLQAMEPREEETGESLKSSASQNKPE